eukprot:scaffold69309_cov65-Phaeocystis_antarctica.AAC.18
MGLQRGTCGGGAAWGCVGVQPGCRAAPAAPVSCSRRPPYYVPTTPQGSTRLLSTHLHLGVAQQMPLGKREMDGAEHRAECRALVPRRATMPLAMPLRRVSSRGDARRGARRHAFDGLVQARLHREVLLGRPRGGGGTAPRLRHSGLVLCPPA